MEDSATALHPNKVKMLHIALLVVEIVMILIASLLVILRFIQRSRIATRRKYWWDDWIILAALACAFGRLVGAVSNKWSAYHVWQYSVDEINEFAKCLLLQETMYNTSIALSKASILFFYGRIFAVDRRLLLVLTVVGFCLFGFCMSAIFGLVFTDDPFQAQWNVAEPHTSIKSKTFYFAMAIINICLDVVILAIPQARVRKLHMSRERKLLLQGVFLLGAFAIVASIVRIIYLRTINMSDITYSVNLPGIWTVIEMDLSIVCACLPTVYGLFKPPKSHDNGIKPSHKFSAPSSIRMLFGSKSNSSYTGIEDPNGGGNRVYIASTRFADESNREPHDTVPLGPVYVQRGFVVE